MMIMQKKQKIRLTKMIIMPLFLINNIREIFGIQLIKQRNMLYIN